MNGIEGSFNKYKPALLLTLLGVTLSVAVFYLDRQALVGDIDEGVYILSLCLLFTGLAGAYAFWAISKQEKASESLGETAHTINERVKELTCLYEATRIASDTTLSIAEMCERIVKVIPPAMQYPEITGASLTLTANTCTTPGLKESPWKMSAGIIAGGRESGKIEIYYLEKRPDIPGGEGPFLKEERELTRGLADMLGFHIERKHAASKFYELLESGPDPVILTDRAGTITMVNGEAEKLIGYVKKELIGNKIETLVPEGARPRHIGHREKYYTAPRRRTMGMGLDLNLAVRTKDGTEIPVEVTLAPINSEGGLMVVSSVHDIREHKKIQQALQEAARLKSEFSSMVSHELRTPLTAIKESLAIVLDGSTGPINEEQKDFLDTSKRNVDRLARLINDVLDFQKLEAGKMQFSMEEDDINTLTLEIEKMMRPSLKGTEVELKVVLGADIPKLRFNRDKMSQVLTNLINNALKFTEKGLVELSTARTGDKVRVSVRDSGMGIKPEDMDKLFKSFSQTDTGLGRKTGGTGLGLAISQKIVEAHGGRIWAESEYGKGSAFIFELPLNT